MNKVSETTRTVKVTDFVQETPPALLISEMVTGIGGRSRLFTQKVQVMDSDLWRRLTSGVRKEDTISVTVKTIWPDNGRYYTCLVSYIVLEASASVTEWTAVAV